MYGFNPDPWESEALWNPETTERRAVGIYPERPPCIIEYAFTSEYFSAVVGFRVENPVYNECQIQSITIAGLPVMQGPIRLGALCAHPLPQRRIVQVGQRVSIRFIGWAPPPGALEILLDIPNPYAAQRMMESILMGTYKKPRKPRKKHQSNTIQSVRSETPAEAAEATEVPNETEDSQVS